MLLPYNKSFLEKEKFLGNWKCCKKGANWLKDT